MNQTFVKIILDRWNASVKNCDDLLTSISDQQLQKEIAPGKNRGIYVLGHLIAVHDNMQLLLDLGDKKYPALAKAFLDTPDKTLSEIPTVNELRSIWKEQKKGMKQQFERFKTDDWFEKHSSVSAEDFTREPHRNKLNIVLTRTTHLAYHTGQLVYLK